jgi:RHS repeat-associated protein
MVYFYSVDGTLLATYGNGSNSDYNVYFAGKQIWEEGSGGGRPVYPDRLGSHVRHFPYGSEPSGGGQEDRVKFATYYRDQTSTLDYARNRYYSRSIARFTSPDPYIASGGPADPQSWNRYSYVQNDPVNWNDSTGLWKQRPEDPLPVGYCYNNPLDPICRSGSMGMGGPGDPGVADTPDGVAVTTAARSVYPNWYATAVRNQAVRVASGVLAQAREECLALFNVGGLGLDPVSLLSSLAGPNSEYGQIRYGVLDDYIVAQTTPLVLPPGDTDNTAGHGYAFVTLNDSVSGGWHSENPTNQAATILHELAHAYEYIYGMGTSGLQPEVGTVQEMAAASKANAALIRERCF